MWLENAKCEITSVNLWLKDQTEEGGFFAQNSREPIVLTKSGPCCNYVVSVLIKSIEWSLSLIVLSDKHFLSGN